MKSQLSIEEVLVSIYNKIEQNYRDFLLLPEYKGKSSLFAIYIETQFSFFIDLVKKIDEIKLVETITEFNEFEQAITKRRFIHLLINICGDFIKILKECYSPNQAKALQDLEILLGMNNKRLRPYLVEQLINYCSFMYSKNDVFYRVRDAKIGEYITDCWHTPFSIRQKSYAGRFSSPGFPCLYLADSPKTCYAEVGELKNGYVRWLGKFQLENKQIICCLDLTIPTKEKILHASAYEKIQLFLTYPLRLLCTTQAEHKSDSFGEEYLFSQVLMKVISHPLNENSGMCSVNGIVYNSTKYKGGINIALPANSINTPPNLDEEYSSILQKKFHHEKPSMIDSGF